MSLPTVPQKSKIKILQKINYQLFATTAMRISRANDAAYPGMWRIRTLDGGLCDTANLYPRKGWWRLDGTTLAA